MYLFNNCTRILLASIWLVSCKPSGKQTAVQNAESDGMEQAMRQEFRMTRDPQLNVIPAERLVAARAYMENLIANGRINVLGWQERGPVNVGGRTRAILIDKRDLTGNTVFAGSVSGGMFKCTNFTSATPTWTIIDDFMPNLAITNIVQDQLHPDTLFASTGEGWFNIDAVRGAGIFKSTNGGTTWTQMASTSGWEYVQDFVIDNNGNFFASLRNLTSAIRGVMRSADRGGSWEQVLGLPLTNFSYLTGRAADLEVASNGDVFATLGVLSRGTVYKSSFASNGANTGAANAWTEITPSRTTICQRLELAVAPSDPNRLYLLMQDSSTNSVSGFYRSFNGGATWDSLAAPAAVNNGANSQCWYNLVAAVDPNNPDILVVGGLNMAKSINAGVTFSTIGSANVHVDHHALVFNGSTKLINGNDGGIYYTESFDLASPAFVNKNNGYNVTQYYACDLHPTTTDYFLAGAQDNGTQRFQAPGLNNTTSATGGDGGFCHIDQTDGNIQITANTGNRYNVSNNGGISFVFASTVFNARGQFINPTDWDDAANILYCGDDPGKYFFITNWSATPAGTQVSVASMGARELTTVKVDPNTANTIWIGASFGNLPPQVLKLTSANSATPTVVSFANLGTTSNANVSSIDIDPANPNHIVAVLSNYGVVSVYESTNGGTSFTSIEGNLPDMPVRWVSFAPTNAQLNGAAGGNGGLIIATELGIWTTSAINGAATQWIPNNGGFANVRTDMVRIRPSDNLAVAATHGRGLFTTIIPTVVTGIGTTPSNTKDFIRYINAEAGRLNIYTGQLLTKGMSVQLVDMSGRVVLAHQFSYQNSSMDISRLATAIYTVRIRGDKNEYYAGKFIKR